MLKYILAFLAIVTVTTPAHGQICVSYFAAQAFTEKQCNEALKVFNHVNTPCTAILWQTFTIKQNNLCAQKFLSKFKDRPHILEVHFSNEAGRRNRRLSQYEFAASLSVAAYNSGLEKRRRGTVRLVQRNAAQIRAFIALYANKNTKAIVSTGLEDNFSNGAYKTILSLIKQAFLNVQNVQIVRNPVGHHEKNYLGADFIELHGIRPSFSPKSKGKCIANLDGISINFHNRAAKDREISLRDLPSFIARHKELDCLTFLWWNEPQGISNKFKHPRSRKFIIESYKIEVINNLIRRHEQ